MALLSKHLLLSEQFAAWKERNIQVPRKIKATTRRNAEVETPELRDYLRGHFCERPFEALETVDEGLVHLCCPDWLPMPVGSIDDLPKAWSGRSAKKIRDSIIDGSFSYCDSINCPHISGRQLLARDSEKAQDLIARFSRPGETPPPRELALSHDRSCNLSCPSCRTQNIVVGKAKQKKLDDQVEESFLPTLRQVEKVYITGSGDPFGSAHFRRLIKRLKRDEFPNLIFNLHSNGQLMDERAWRDLDLSGRVNAVEISIDAAKAETYAIVRRGGTFERLLKNLAFIKTLRETGEIKELHFSMVVQKLNFREMPDFVRLGQRFSADNVSFQMLRNWGTFSEEEFAEEYIGRSHPDFDELLKVLEAPLLHLPNVSVGNVAYHTELSQKDPASASSAARIEVLDDVA